MVSGQRSQEAVSAALLVGQPLLFHVLNRTEGAIFQHSLIQEFNQGSLKQ